MADRIIAPLGVRNWKVFNTSGLRNLPDGSLSWNINGSGYIYTKPVKSDKKRRPVWLTPLTEVHTLVLIVRIETTGEPKFLYGYGPENPCLTPASAHPLLWAKKNNWYDPNARWWAHTPIWLDTEPGNMTFRIPLIPSHWSNVNGHYGDEIEFPEAITGWKNMLSNPGSVGLTFGGGCFYGHGVTVIDGTARFILVNMYFE
jgi:hypothetical protein